MGPVAVVANHGAGSRVHPMHTSVTVVSAGVDSVPTMCAATHDSGLGGVASPGAAGSVRRRAQDGGSTVTGAATCASGAHAIGGCAPVRTIATHVGAGGHR